MKNRDILLYVMFTLLVVLAAPLRAETSTVEYDKMRFQCIMNNPDPYKRDMCLHWVDDIQFKNTIPTH